MTQFSSRPDSTAICCAYLRRSQQDIEAEREGHFNTLEKHRRMLEFTSEEYGYTISKWYEEIVSGETIAAREQMQDMLHEIAHGRYDIVFCVEASRLGRGSGGDQDTIVNAFKYTNTWLITELKVYDPSSKADMKLLRKELQDANSEWDTTTERLNRGRIRATKDGCWIHGRAPYGWKTERINRKWQLVPDPVTHERMIKMCEMSAEGATLRTIAHYMESQGWETPKGRQHWTDRSVRNIILSLANVGYVYFGERKTVREMDPETFSVHKTIQRQPKDGYLICEGLHMGNGTISQDTYDKICKTVLKGLPYDPSRGLVNPLSGLLKCAKCGTAMTLHKFNHFTGKRANSYQHNVKRRDCTCKCAPYADIMDILASSLEQTMANMEIVINDNDGESERKRCDEQLLGISKQLEKNDAAMSKAMHAYEADIYSDEEFMERKRVIQAERGQLEKFRMEVQQQHTNVKDVEAQSVMLHDALDLIRGGATPQAINDALRRVISRIDYTNNGRPRSWENDIHLDIFLK